MSISEKQKEKILELAGQGKLAGRDAFHVIFLDYLERTYHGKGLLCGLVAAVAFFISMCFLY